MGSMSEKTKCLETLEDIQKEHKSLLVAIELLVRTGDAQNSSVKEPASCSFSKWSENSESIIQQRIGIQLYEKLSSLHEQWHTTYMKIYTIYFPKKRGLLGKLITHKPSTLEHDKATSYLDDLHKIEEEFEKTITVCQRRIQALSESKFR